MWSFPKINLYHCSPNLPKRTPHHPLIKIHSLYYKNSIFPPQVKIIFVLLPEFAKKKTISSL